MLAFTTNQLYANYYKYTNIIFHQLIKNETSFFCSLIFTSIVILLFPRGYQVNDDIGILSNIQIGFPVSFMSLPLGYFLSFLYLNISGSVPWYGLFLYSVHVISFWFLIMALVKLKETIVIPFLILYASFYADFLMHVGYNNAAFMIGVNSLFLFLATSATGEKYRKSSILLLGFCFSLSYLIRIQAIKAIIPFGLFIVCLFFVRRLIKPIQVLIFSIPLVIFIFSQYYIDTYLLPSEHKQYQEFNKLRGKVHDYPIYAANANNKEMLEKNGWSENDYKMIGSWFFIDENRYNVETFQNIFTYSKPISSTFTINTIGTEILNLINTYSSYLQLMFFTIIALKLLNQKITYFYLIFQGSLVLYMVFFMRFPTRIGAPLLLFTNTSLFLINTIKNHRNKTKILSWLL